MMTFFEVFFTLPLTLSEPLDDGLCLLLVVGLQYYKEKILSENPINLLLGELKKSI